MDPIIGLSIVNARAVLDVIALVQGPFLLNRINAKYSLTVVSAGYMPGT